MEFSMSRVLVIGDLHLPAEREDYLDFCKDLRKKYKTTETVFIGDVLKPPRYFIPPKESWGWLAWLSTTDLWKEWKLGRKHFQMPRYVSVTTTSGSTACQLTPVFQPYLKDYPEVFNTTWVSIRVGYRQSSLHPRNRHILRQHPRFQCSKARAQSTVRTRTLCC